MICGLTLLVYKANVLIIVFSLIHRHYSFYLPGFDTIKRACNSTGLAIPSVTGQSENIRRIVWIGNHFLQIDFLNTTVLFDLPSSKMNSEERSSESRNASEKRKCSSF